MAIDINIRITLAAGEQYTDYENGILAAVAGGAAPTLTGDTPVKGLTAPELKSEVVPAPAAEAPAAPKRTRRTKAQIEAEEKAAAEAEAAAAEAEEEAAAVEPEADPLAALEADMDDEPAADAPTTTDAVAKATQVLADGGTATVKAALAAAGVKRVSELKGAAIADFIAALEG